MLNGHHNFEQEHGLELVSYIYGELSDDRRSAFESHLQACDECVLELANYSDARLGVIEWRREDFDHLATPEVVITESQPEYVHAGGRRGLAAVLDSIFRLPIFAQAGLGLAAAALAIAMVYFAGFTPTGSDNLASNSSLVVQAPAHIEDPVRSAPEAVIATVDQPESQPIYRKSAHKLEKRQYAAVETVTVRRPVAAVVKKSETAATVKTSTKVAPRLSSFQDDDDRSLRLADLLAEIGSSEE